VSPPRTRPQNLEEALARAGDGVFAIGPDGRVMLWNRAAERLLGWKASEVLGRPCCDVLAGSDDHGNRLCYQGCHVMSLIRLGEPVQHFEMRTPTKAGRPVWIDVTVLEAPAGAGTRALAIHIFRDVTAAKELMSLVHERLAPPAAAEGADLLTRREIEILRHIAAGESTSALAERLHVSPATVRNHAQNIFTKLGVHSRLEAVAWAHRHRLF